MVQQISHQLPEGDSAHRAAEAYQPGNRTDNVGRKEVGGKNHHQGGPRLLSEICQTEYRSAQATGSRGTSRMDGITAALNPSASFLATPSEN